jgi:hypothetical protein
MHRRAADFSRDYDGACLQMRVSYSPAARFFLFLLQWTDCSLAAALGLLRILIYEVARHHLGFFSTTFIIFIYLPWSLLIQPSLLLSCPGLCGWKHHHVHPREESKRQGVLRQVFLFF